MHIHDLLLMVPMVAEAQMPETLRWINEATMGHTHGYNSLAANISAANREEAHKFIALTVWRTNTETKLMPP